MLAWGFLFMSVTMIELHGKGPYMAPLYPIMFAAGATLFEQLTAPGRARTTTKRRSNSHPDSWSLNWPTEKLSSSVRRWATRWASRWMNRVIRATTT